MPARRWASSSAWHRRPDALLQHKEHINEVATLRAMGASGGFIRKVILTQASLSALRAMHMGSYLSMW